MSLVCIQAPILLFLGSPDVYELAPIAVAAELAREWLAEHQDEDGRWDADGFMEHDPADAKSGGPGSAEFDVGVTGLALLAFLSSGQTHLEGPQHEAVERGLEWLCSQQQQDGLIGERVGHAYLYGHGIATLALCEAHVLGGDETWKIAAQRAVGFALKARNPYAAWRYDCPPVGDNDSSVTGWMVAALRSARDGGLAVDEPAFDGARLWYDEVTDPANGRVGYDQRGSGSSRIPSINDHFPVDETETMTAVGLFARFLLRQDPEKTPVMKKHSELLLKSLPGWSSLGRTNDHVYWLFGTLAMYRMSGASWDAWAGAMQGVLLAKQIDAGPGKGSWDPDGPWGPLGGRVYSTALGAIASQVHARDSRFVGLR